jgi:diadenosine tetraphosphatase ApaH/serine/threonine PP2A family protein phosphatase
MRYAIVADIHSNLIAFNAVLDDAGRRGVVDGIWCLGDLVGYGPDPNECIELLRGTDHICVVGNHDLGAIGKADINAFNPDAAAACNWTAGQLNPSSIAYLEGLPHSLAEESFTLVHGSPREPIWEYLMSTSVAKENFAYFKTQFCLVGHTHAPITFSYGEGGSCSARSLVENIRLFLGENRLIINPGAVGQPRDGDPRASYALYDSEMGTVTLHRVDYNIRSTQNRMVSKGLPLRLVPRLSSGI